MNIYGVADGIITTLYHKGILNRISDLYKLEDNYEKMLEIEGFGKKKANNIIEAVKSRLTEWMIENDIADDGKTEAKEELTIDQQKAFIVHGHDGELRESVARLLEKQGITPIILFEQPNQGATIIEKFEVNSSVGAAICLFSADDIGNTKNAKTTIKAINGTANSERKRMQ